MACAILEKTSGLEPSSETTAPRFLKLVTVPNFLFISKHLFIVNILKFPTSHHSQKAWKMIFQIFFLKTVDELLTVKALNQTAL